MLIYVYNIIPLPPPHAHARMHMRMQITVNKTQKKKKKQLSGDKSGMSLSCHSVLVRRVSLVTW